MNGSKLSLHAQRGVSLSGLMGLLAILAVFAILAAKIFPTYLEFSSAREGIKFAKQGKETPREIQSAFDRHADINAITSLTGKDLKIQKIDGQQEVWFDYDKKIPLMKNVNLVIRYAATTAPSGTVPERDEPETK